MKNLSELALADAISQRARARGGPRNRIAVTVTV